MKPSKILHPETLRSVRQDLLLRWLGPMAEYLARRGLRLPRQGVEETIDYEQLTRILMTPTPDLPEDLAESLFLIEAMGHPSGMDALIEGADLNGLKLELEEDLTPVDLALKVWLLD